MKLWIGLVGAVAIVGGCAPPVRACLQSGNDRVCQLARGEVRVLIPKQSNGKSLKTSEFFTDPQVITRPRQGTFVPKRLITTFQIEDENTNDLATQFAPPIELRVKYTAQDYRQDLSLGIFVPTIDCLPIIPKIRVQATGCWKALPNVTFTGQGPSPNGGEAVVQITDLGDPTLGWGGAQ